MYTKRRPSAIHTHPGIQLWGASVHPSLVQNGTGGMVVQWVQHSVRARPTQLNTSQVSPRSSKLHVELNRTIMFRSTWKLLTHSYSSFEAASTYYNYVANTTLLGNSMSELDDRHFRCGGKTTPNSKFTHAHAQIGCLVHAWLHVKDGAEMR